MTSSASAGPPEPPVRLLRILGEGLLLAAILLGGGHLAPRAVGQEQASPTAIVEVTRVVPDPQPGWGVLEVPAAPDLEGPRALGQVLFARLCSACHGLDGRGDGPLADTLPRRPRDLVGERLRTRSVTGAIRPEDLYRTLTVGAGHFGMPAFGHRTVEERWALVAWVLSLNRAEAAAGPSTAVVLPARPATIDPALGASTFAASCASCHGATGDGVGPLASALAAQGAPPTDLRHGPDAFRGGARAEDVVRTVMLGRPGTAMAQVALTPDALWAVAEHVAGLATQGVEARRTSWGAFFEARRALGETEGSTRKPEEESRWRAPLSAQWAVAPDGTRGCLACHGGVAPISSGLMALSIDAFAGGDANRSCTVCHDGDARANTRAEAHAGFVPNPGSLWITSVGLGCARCHSDRGALTSIMGRPLPEPMGGALQAVRSRQTDPTGASGANHAYRMQRALMAQETGKAFLATASAGLVPRNGPRYTDFPLDDPDGPSPCAGSNEYRDFMARAERLGQVHRLDRGVGVPTPAEVQAGGGTPEQAAYIDYYRKECSRCHLWGEGKPADGERRSSGCSACHVLNDRPAWTASDDPTIPKKKSGHPLRHELVLAIPESQCNHCHTRGQETLHSEAHQVAGIGCVDCHTSIDVHGDGNIYPSIAHQLELSCADCHGTAAAAPWDLPLGQGTPAAGKSPRGVRTVGGVDHLLTSRGNARANWRRDGDRVVVRSFGDGRERVAPLLRDAVAPVVSLTATKAHEQSIPGHDALACSACHNRSAPRCGQCHVKYFTAGAQQDWLLSAIDHDPITGRQRRVETPGEIDFRAYEGHDWGEPELRPDPDGRLVPRIRGCDVTFTRVGPRGQTTPFLPRMNPRSPDYPPPVAPSMAHEKSLPPRTCVECHTDGPPAGR